MEDAANPPVPEDVPAKRPRGRPAIVAVGGTYNRLTVRDFLSEQTVWERDFDNRTIRKIGVPEARKRHLEYIYIACKVLDPSKKNGHKYPYCECIACGRFLICRVDQLRKEGRVFCPWCAGTVPLWVVNAAPADAKLAASKEKMEMLLRICPSYAETGKFVIQKCAVQGCKRDAKKIGTTGGKMRGSCGHHNFTVNATSGDVEFPKN